jgi:hypothetical protein
MPQVLVAVVGRVVVIWEGFLGPGGVVGALEPPLQQQQLEEEEAAEEREGYLLG